MESSPNNFIQGMDAYITRSNGKHIKLYLGVSSLFRVQAGSWPKSITCLIFWRNSVYCMENILHY